MNIPDNQAYTCTVIHVNFFNCSLHGDNCRGVMLSTHQKLSATSKDILVVNSLTDFNRSLGMIEIPLQMYFLSRTESFLSELDTLVATVMSPNSSP